MPVFWYDLARHVLRTSESLCVADLVLKPGRAKSYANAYQNTGISFYGQAYNPSEYVSTITQTRLALAWRDPAAKRRVLLLRCG